MMILDSPQAMAHATEQLCHCEPRMAEVVRRIGPCQMAPWQYSLFERLIYSVVGQQLSMQAARTIRSRLLATLACEPGALTASDILACSPDKLRRAGLSGAKVRAIVGIAMHWHKHPDWEPELKHLDDAALQAALVQLPGVGPWTAHMVMMFGLGRPDVWPVGDLGIRKAMQHWLSLPECPKPEEIRSAGDPWRPWRSLAAWYLWRWLEVERNNRKS